MFGAQELAAYARDGFVQVPGLLDPQEVAGYQAELDRLATDPTVRHEDRCIVEKSSNEVRSIFEVHKISNAIARIAADERDGPDRSSARTSTSTRAGSTTSRASAAAACTARGNVTG